MHGKEKRDHRFMRETDEDPLTIVTRFGEAWAHHDLDATMSLVHPDAIFDATGPAPDGQIYRGRSEIREAWKPIFANVSSMFTVEDTYAVTADSVVQTRRYDWGEGHVRGVDLFMVRDNKILEKRSYVKG